MLRKLTVVAGLLAMGMFAGVAQAADVKIAYVNIATILQQAPQTEAIRVELEKELMPKKEEVEAKQAELQKLGETLSKKDADKISDAEKEQYGKLRQEFGQMMQEYQQTVNKRKNEELGGFQNTVLREVQTYARENGYSLVVSEGVLYASPTVDITAQILARLQDAAKADSGK